jgi:hypothetical protein
MASFGAWALVHSARGDVGWFGAGPVPSAHGRLVQFRNVRIKSLAKSEGILPRRWDRNTVEPRPSRAPPGRL